MMDDDGFILVKSRKNRMKNARILISLDAKTRSNAVNHKIDENSEINRISTVVVDENTFIANIERLEKEFLLSEFFLNFCNVLEKHRLVLSHWDSISKKRQFTSSGAISKIICLGLGNFTSNRQSQYQLVFLRCIEKALMNKEQSKTTISVFDPVHTRSEENIIRQFGYEAVMKNNNMEGKYIIKDGSGVFFYLPHCPKQLTNNILWANWHPSKLGSSNQGNSNTRSLGGIHILGNSFDRIITSMPNWIVRQSAEFILLLIEKVHETKIKNCFFFSDVFNDTSLHSFPIEKLPSSHEPFWQIANERGPPAYTQDTEFILK